MHLQRLTTVKCVEQCHRNVFICWFNRFEFFFIMYRVRASSVGHNLLKLILTPFNQRCSQLLCAIFCTLCHVHPWLLLLNSLIAFCISFFIVFTIRWINFVFFFFVHNRFVEQVDVRSSWMHLMHFESMEFRVNLKASMWLIFFFFFRMFIETQKTIWKNRKKSMCSNIECCAQGFAWGAGSKSKNSVLFVYFFLFFLIWTKKYRKMLFLHLVTWSFCLRTFNYILWSQNIAYLSTYKLFSSQVKWKQSVWKIQNRTSFKFVDIVFSLSLSRIFAFHKTYFHNLSKNWNNVRGSVC